jgi:hypothetical protein
MCALERWFRGASLLDAVDAKLKVLNDPNSGHRAALPH